MEDEKSRMSSPSADGHERESQGQTTSDQGLNGCGSLPELVSRDFEGNLIRTLERNGELWVVAADVCRALGFSPNKGSYADHLAKLDDDEKQLVDRTALLKATGTPGLNPGVASAGEGSSRATSELDANDPLATGKGPTAWIVSESGLYTLVLRSRRAVTPGSSAHRFRRWVTKTVLPSIRKTGAYASKEDGNFAIIRLNADELARYIILTVPNQPPHIRRTEVLRMIDEMNVLETDILCHSLKTIGCWWERAQELRFMGHDPLGSRVMARLERSIRDGSTLAEEQLRLMHPAGEA